MSALLLPTVVAFRLTHLTLGRMRRTVPLCPALRYLTVTLKDIADVLCLIPIAQQLESLDVSVAVSTLTDEKLEAFVGGLTVCHSICINADAVTSSIFMTRAPALLNFKACHQHLPCAYLAAARVCSGTIDNMTLDNVGVKDTLIEHLARLCPHLTMLIFHKCFPVSMSSPLTQPHAAQFKQRFLSLARFSNLRLLDLRFNATRELGEPLSLEWLRPLLPPSCLLTSTRIT